MAKARKNPIAKTSAVTAATEFQDALKSEGEDRSGHHGKNHFIGPGPHQVLDFDLPRRVDEEDQGKDKGEVKTAVLPLLEHPKSRRVDMKYGKNDAHDQGRSRGEAL